MPLTAVRHVRKMRGGAQAHLLQADDGNWYVVKFRNNPQHPRVLVNELLAAAFLDYLRISVPETAIIQVTPAFLDANPEVHLTLGTNSLPVAAGWHFGSRYPSDPTRIAVYDFLPDSLLSQVVNLEDFRAILAFDKWVGNADGRQAVFYRAMVRDSEAGSGHPGFVTRMVDEGYCFNGPHWDFPESAVQGLYSRPVVYQDVRSLDDFQPWLNLIVHFPEEVVDRAWKRVPVEWIAEEEDALECMLGELMRRRERLPELISASRTARTNPFPNWR